jgi:hypothetical protein
MKIGKEISIGNFYYKLNNENLEFIKGNKNKIDLAAKYVAYKIYQNSKGFNHYISFNEFSKIYVKVKKAKNFKELEKFSDKLTYETNSKSLSIYLNYLLENQLSPWLINVISPKQSIRYRFVEADKIVVYRIDEEETIRRYNEDFDIEVGKEYYFLIFIDTCLKFKFYPNEENIFNHCRSVNGDYYTAASRLYGDRDINYTL